jgi:ABC-type antimicrobial peptide transport system permease subunit
MKGRKRGSAVEESGIERQITLPLGMAIKISFQSLRIRFWRSIITTAGIFLGIAFLVSVLVSTSITNAVIAEAEEGIQARQIWLIAISLLVTVIGITNAMLMAVTERYREIGTMKCLGALDRFIVELFVLEAGFQGLAGSIGGSLTGVILMTLASMARFGARNVISHYPVFEILIWVVGGIILGVILAVVGAIYPAYRAAKLPPAEAMRVEI